MAKKSSKLKEHIENLSLMIIMHYLKIKMYPENREQIHWRRELFTWLNSISEMDVKTSSGKLKSSMYFGILMEKVSSMKDFIEVSDKIESQYGSVNISYNDMYFYLKEFLHSISDIISTNDFNKETFEYYVNRKTGEMYDS